MSHPSYSDPDWMQKFLHNAAKYFENRPTDGEDTAYWANTYNAEKCRKIADEIEKLREVLRAFIYTGNVVQGYRVGQNPPPPTASEEEAWAHYGGSEFHYQQWLEWRAVQMGRELLGEKG
jgi:hypothetical protein